MRIERFSGVRARRLLAVEALGASDSICFEVDDLDLDITFGRTRDQKFIDDAEQNSQRSSQTKTHFTPQTSSPVRPRRVHPDIFGAASTRLKTSLAK